MSYTIELTCARRRADAELCCGRRQEDSEHLELDTPIHCNSHGASLSWQGHSGSAGPRSFVVTTSLHSMMSQKFSLSFHAYCRQSLVSCSPRLFAIYHHLQDNYPIRVDGSVKGGSNSSVNCLRLSIPTSRTSPSLILFLNV